MGVLWLMCLGALAPPAELVSAPVAAVTVFSDRAKVVRRVQLPLSRGAHRLAFPALPPGADPGSVTLEASGAEVARVEVRRGALGELAPSEVDQAIAELDAARAAMRALSEQRANREGERALLLRLRPAAPAVDAKGQPRPLETGGWKDSTAFFDARLKSLDDALAALDQKDREAALRLQTASEKAGLLANGGAETLPVQVEAVVQSAGATATLSLSYLVTGARWTPAYDVRYRPGEAKVEVGFAAFVSQQTGEDWPQSRLTLSTAVPSTLRDVPALTVWKIGEKDRFIPTPVAKPVPHAEPPALAAAAPPEEQLRARLREALRPPTDVSELERRVDELKEQIFRDQARMQLLSEAVLAGTVEGVRNETARVAQLEQDARARRDVVRLNGLEQKLAELRALQQLAVDSNDRQRQLTAQGDADGARREKANVAAAGKKAKEVADQAQAVRGAESSEIQELSLRAAPEPTSVEFSGELASAPGAVLDRLSSVFSRGSGPAPQQVAFLTPRAWQLPSFAPGLPAALAGGYDFVYPAARPEALASAPDARRVPLFRKTFAAEPELTLVPAVSPFAYLMAKVTNDGDRPLLRGAANLYVGGDLVGQATVDTTQVGEQTRLPLGIDDAVKVERKVDLVTATEGVFSKDDVSTYQVRIEILSSRAQAMKARVLDELPLSGAEKVEVKLLQSQPAARYDKDTGALEWQTALAPGQKQTLTYSYRLSRPKGARLQQWSP